MSSVPGGKPESLRIGFLCLSTMAESGSEVNARVHCAVTDSPVSVAPVLNPNGRVRDDGRPDHRPGETRESRGRLNGDLEKIEKY